eukprot:356123-Chlamydomonas_euryale.AAC.17
MTSLQPGSCSASSAATMSALSFDTTRFVLASTSSGAVQRPGRVAGAGALAHLPGQGQCGVRVPGGCVGGMAVPLVQARDETGSVAR